MHKYLHIYMFDCVHRCMLIFCVVEATAHALMCAHSDFIRCVCKYKNMHMHIYVWQMSIVAGQMSIVAG